MKNILKKIGLIGIIIGVLSPFIKLPQVNANNCTHHINQYLFLDVFIGYAIEDYVVEDLSSTNEVGKRNFTNFIYTFPVLNSGETLNIIDAGSVNLMNDKGFENYHKAYNELTTRYTQQGSQSYTLFGDWKQRDYTYETVTTLVHGKWAEANEAGIGEVPKEEELEAALWKPFRDLTNFKTSTIQDAISNSGEDVTILSRFGGASYNRNENAFSVSTTYGSDAKAFIQQVMLDYNNGIYNTPSIKDNYLVRENNVIYFNLNIDRRITEADLKKLTFGVVEGNTNKIISPATGQDEVTNSYEAMLEWKDNGFSCPSGSKCTLTDGNFDINANGTYYWPSMYNVEYDICKPISASAKWSLTYDSSVTDDSVKNMPNPTKVSDLTDNKVKLSDTKPERTGYVFKGWCTEKDGKGTCKQPGEEMPNADKIDMIVHAFWLEEGTKDPDKYGVMSYVIAFSVVGIIAAGLYYSINKKNIFKQI